MITVYALVRISVFLTPNRAGIFTERRPTTQDSGGAWLEIDNASAPTFEEARKKLITQLQATLPVSLMTFFTMSSGG